MRGPEGIAFTFPIRTSFPTNCLYARSLSLPKNNLPAIKRFGIFVRRVGFDSPKPKERIEGIFRKPLFASLCRKPFHEALHFLFTLGLRQWHKDVGLAKITVILRYFVLEYLVTAEGVPRQLADHTMVLVQVMSIVGEDQIGLELELQLFKTRLDRFSTIREKALLE